MLNAEQKYYLTLLRCALNNEPVPKPQNDLNYKEIYFLAKKQSTEVMVYNSLQKLLDYNEEFKSHFQILKYDSIATVATIKETIQEIESERLFEEFEKNKIKYLPLKGFVIKNHYPTPNMRTSCDIDILYDNANTADVKNIFNAMGYSEHKSLDTTQISFVKPPYLNIEMHNMLMPQNFASYDFCKSIWERALPVENNSHKYEYKMTAEDFYIFQTAHAAKHFNDGGTGIRSVTDTYVFMRAFDSQIDKKSLNDKLKQNKLFEFSENLIGIANMLFADGEENPFYVQMVEYILSSENSGSMNHKTANRIFAKDGSKFKYLISIIFPSLQHMSDRYKWLPRFPFMLPFMWIVRFFTVLILSPFKIKTNYKAIKSTDKKSMETANLMQEKNGLGFYSKKQKKSQAKHQK